VWTPEQLGDFLHYIQPHRLSAFFWLAAYTGARRGELLNLRWFDISLDNPIGTIHIRGSVGMVDRKRVEGTTKCGRERNISIDATTVAMMRDHQKRQAVDRERALGSWIETDHVFRREIGSPLFPSTPMALMTKLQRDFNTDNRRQPLPVIRLHDLRHIHATLLLRAGVPVHVVAARLGHADAAITLRVYAHVLGDQAQEAADTFARVLNSPGSR
jgi:integrase